MSVPNKRKDLMLNKTQKSTDIAEQRKSANPKDMISRGEKQCCPFLNRVRFYKTQSLKDPKIFSIFNSGNMDKKRKLNNEIDENASISMMYYL